MADGGRDTPWAEVGCATVRSQHCKAPSIVGAPWSCTMKEDQFDIMRTTALHADGLPPGTCHSLTKEAAHEGEPRQQAAAPFRI